MWRSVARLFFTNKVDPAIRCLSNTIISEIIYRDCILCSVPFFYVFGNDHCEVNYSAYDLYRPGDSHGITEQHMARQRADNCTDDVDQNMQHEIR